MKKLHLFLLVFLLFLGTFIRFYQLSSIPSGLNNDETAIGYNAYSILKTGKDEYGHTFPLYFKSFGDYKLPVYIYSVALSEKIFGLTSFAVRFPSALSGSLAILLVYFLIVLLTKKKGLALIITALFTINPANIFFSHAGFEDNLALTATLAGTVFFLLGAKKKNIFFFIFSLLSFGLSLYAYNVTRILSPVIFVTLSVLYWKEIRILARWKKITLSILILLILSPFVLTIGTNGGASSAKGALITSNDITAKALEWRAYVIQAPFVGFLLFNRYIFMLWQYINNIVSFLSPNFFYVTGSIVGSQGIGTNGFFYLFEFPFFIAGIVLLFTKKEKSLRIFFIWLILTLLLASLSKEVPQATRGYFLLIPGIVFSGYGIYQFLLWKNKLKYVLGSLLIPVVIYSVATFFISYFIRFPISYAPDWNEQDKTIALYLQKEAPKYQKILIDPDTNLRYTSLLFYQKISPQVFLNTVHPVTPGPDGLIWNRSFEKYDYTGIDWKNVGKQKNMLIVTTPDHAKKLSTNGILHIFYYPERTVVYSAQEKIYQFPVRDEAYVVFTTNQL